MCMFNSVNNGCDVCAADLRARVSFLCIFFQVDFFCMSLLRWGFDVINQDSDACPLKRHLICRLQLRTGCIKSRKAASPKFWRTMKVQFSGRDSGTGNDTTCAFGILSTRLQRKKKQKTTTIENSEATEALLGTEAQQLAKFRVQQWMIRAPHFPPLFDLSFLKRKIRIWPTHRLSNLH